MKSPFPYSNDNKRYHTLAFHNLQAYGGRVCKATVSAGLSCPNIDGLKGTGGCVFCARTRETRSVAEQFAAEKARILAKYPSARIMLYYAQNSNTYCSPETLSGMLREAETLGAFAVSVATRPDCLDADKARILAECPLPLTVELGLQTVHDRTAETLNRCHSYADFLEGYRLLKAHDIRVCVHIINGLPNETAEMMLETARTLGRLRPDGVKIHSLHVLRGTRLHEMYQNGEYTPLEKDVYVDITARQLELLPPETVIERVTGDGDKSLLAAPRWSMDKIAVLGGIDRRLADLDTYQGRRFGDEAIG
ncbi:MAG: TIGR01212 family radical SAM protein [Oscillospiraceae bacterium]|nr:TIGR01212 family radical SAM protein [Oscillospiraceae bacterium]